MTIYEERVKELSNNPDYEIISEDKNGITFKHLKCGQITTKTKKNFSRAPRCPNKKCVKNYKTDPSYKLKEITPRKRISYFDRIKKLEKDKDYEILYYDEKIVKFKHLICGEISTKKRRSFEKTPRCNNNKCIKELREKNSLKKHGIKNIVNSKEAREKRKKTCLEKYGTEYAFQSKEIKEKIKKYIDNKTEEQKKEILKKYKQTCLEKYGVENPNQSKEVINKALRTRNSKYYKEKILNFKKIIPLFSEEEFNGVGNYSTRFKWQCKKCSTIFETYLKCHIPKCPKCYPPNYNISSIETEIADWLNMPEKNRNKRFYYDGKSFYELDIYIPEYSLGIELNGIYWHSEIHGKKDKNYHDNKTNYFLNKGIQLLHIWDVEWINKQNIVKSIIMSKLGKVKNRIYARKCEIKGINSQESRKFLNNNHIQGEINSSVKLGLFYEDELVSILTLGKSRFNKNYDYEIHRFCNKLNTSVIGGFSKLLKYFTTNYSNSIVTYADRRYSTGNLYENNGFNLIRISQPNYYYTDSNYNFLQSRNKYQKHKLSQLLEDFDSNLTEWENMQMNGYDRVWDCGNYVYELK
jgi:hypothetical protein